MTDDTPPAPRFSGIPGARNIPANLDLKGLINAVMKACEITAKDIVDATRGTRWPVSAPTISRILNQATSMPSPETLIGLSVGLGIHRRIVGEAAYRTYGFLAEDDPGCVCIRVGGAVLVPLDGNDRTPEQRTAIANVAQAAARDELRRQRSEAVPSPPCGG